ncbi:MAG: hypothetical protein VKQ33_08980 [Candidatus Sericytochromatia bacterium]|nr:hypothetical protein [Candidatus Sericytochromatia bacterium]
MTDDELEPHLRAALGEVRDRLEVRRHPQPPGPPLAAEGELPAHLAGRAPNDRFTRQGARPSPPPLQRKPPRLERHLAERLEEVADERVSGAGPTAWEAYQAMRKRLQGG